MALLETLVDNFNDNTLNPSLWTPSVSGGATASETNGRMELVLAPASASSATLLSTSAYSLIGSGAYIQVQQVPSGTSSVLFTVFDASGGATNFNFWWEYESGVLRAKYDLSTGTVVVATLTFSASTHRWWRVRESSGTVYWDTSADNIAWTVRGSFLHGGLSMSTCKVYVYAYTNSQPAPGSLYFDNFNFGFRETSIAGTITLGSDLDPTALHYSSISGTILLGGSATAERVITPVAGKEYVYRVYRANGTYIGIWRDVTSELTYSQRLNTPGASTTVRLARSANRTIEARENITDQVADPLTTEDGQNLVAVFQTSNTVGEDTDVDLNYNVDVYVHYGGFENLLTEAGEELLAEDGDFIIVAIGAPLGVRVFSGFIVDYSAVYGPQDGVEVTLLSHGHELSQEVVKDGSNTTRTYSTTAHDAIIKSVLDVNPGTMSYDSASIEVTGSTITQTFRLNTKLEAIQSVYDQSPAGWFWYGNVADNNIYFQAKAATARHTFILGRQIKGINVKRSMEDLRNTIYFVGGNTGGGTILYKKYTDSASVTAWRQGLHRITDRRYTLAASSQTRADKELDRYADPIYTTTATILSEVFNIEEIALGQVVAFAGFGNFVDDLLLQIVGFSYGPYEVSLELGELLDRQQDVIQETVEDLQGEQYIDIPNAPS